MSIKTHLPYLLSVLTLVLMYLAGIKWRWTWVYGLVSQFCWTLWYIEVQAWGLMPLAVCLTIMYIKNHFSWNPQHKFWSHEK